MAAATDRTMADPVFCIKVLPPTAIYLRSSNFDRKWEVVSAYQKCVRRGLTDRALWLIGGFLR